MKIEYQIYCCCEGEGIYEVLKDSWQGDQKTLKCNKCGHVLNLEISTCDGEKEASR